MKINPLGMVVRSVHRVQHAISHLAHNPHELCHMVYTGMVSVEAHGNYRYAAGALFVLGLAAAFGLLHGGAE